MARQGHPRLFPLVLLCLAATACGRASPPSFPPSPISDTGGSPHSWTQTGIASWYGEPFHGRTTASGQVYDMEAMTAAHLTLPFGTRVFVENLENGLTTQVIITDRGPYVDGRIVDLSRAAARELGLLGPGIARVRLALLDAPFGPECWEVQVGSYLDSRNAELRQSELRNQGETVTLQPGPDGATRVVLGPYRDGPQAVTAAGRYQGFVVTCGRN